MIAATLPLAIAVVAGQQIISALSSPFLPSGSPNRQHSSSVAASTSTQQLNPEPAARVSVNGLVTGGGSLAVLALPLWYRPLRPMRPDRPDRGRCGLLESPLVKRASDICGADGPERERPVVQNRARYMVGVVDQPRDIAAERTDPPAEQEQRVGHRVELEFGSREEWDDPKREWRRLFSELLGTFFLVLVAAGGGILVGEGQISLAAAVVAPGLMVMAIILFMGAVSGAHLNPAVSLAFALRRDFPWRRVPGYIIIQLIGATLASLFLLAVFGNVQHLGRRCPGRI